MAYIGKEPGSGLRGRFVYTATAGQTSFTGADSLGRTLTYTDSEYTDVFLNGVKLDKTDYTATSGTSIVLDSGASADDTLEILAFDTFGLFSGEFAQDVSVGGDLTASDDIKMTSDSAQIAFGADSEVTLTHVADTGLTLKHTATADDKPINLTLATGETDMAANDVLGKISFQAPDEGTGTDAILVSGAVQARAEGDFSSSSNATSLDFMTGASEAATTKMTLTSAGALGIANTSPHSNLDVRGSGEIFTIEGDGGASAEMNLSLINGTGNKSAIINFGKNLGTSDRYLGRIIYEVDNNNMDFYTNGGRKLRILTGGGIVFGSDTATANALDDYEEGTWTPVYQALTSNPTVTHSVQLGRYVKIGQFVNVMFRIQTSAASGGGGALVIGGLPFAPTNVSSLFASGPIGFSSAFTNFAPQTLLVSPNDTQVQLIRNSGTDGHSALGTAITTGELTNSSSSNDVIGALSYRTD